MPSRRHVLLGLGALPLASLSTSASLLPMLLTGCGEGRPPAVALRPVPIAAADECAVCGMQIRGFPGPKGEAHVSGRESADRGLAQDADEHHGQNHSQKHHKGAHKTAPELFANGGIE